MSVPVPAAASLVVEVVREIVEHAAKFVTGEGAQLGREAIEKIVKSAVDSAFAAIDKQLRAELAELRARLEAQGVAIGLELLGARCDAVRDAFIPRGPGVVARVLDGVQVELVDEITDEDRAKEAAAFAELRGHSPPEGSSER